VHTEDVASDPNVLQIRWGANVTLVLVRDRELREYKFVFLERGVITRRTEAAIPEDQHERVAKFLAVPLYAQRQVSIITDDRPFVPAPGNPDDDITKPE